ncbi:MAG: mechanosensitive ion channel [Cytophagales bacterium]|nr:mechanosensitive ion channel [Cytophagales bacterium]
MLEQLKSNDQLVQIGLTLLTVLLFLLLRLLFSRRVVKRALRYNFEDTRTIYIKKAINAGLTVLMLVVLGIIWEISLKGLSLYVASVLTVVGVGLFANWSIVSNITASVILFFFFPFKIGSKVKIMDGDNSAEGEVLGVSLFSIQIRRADGQDIYYPNNLAIQKSIVHLKESKSES